MLTSRYLPPIILSILLFLPSSVTLTWAQGRRLVVSNIPVDSVHGGVINNKVCVTANMTQITSTVDEGVLEGLHVYEISLTNVSSIDQHVLFVIKKGTRVDSKNSNVDFKVIPFNPGPSGVVSSNSSRGPYITIAAGETYKYTVSMRCSSASCLIKDNSAIYGTDFSDDSSPPGATGQVCISMTSNLLLEIWAQEDIGAINGSITTFVHRTAGWKDYSSASPSYPLNGGRPF